MWKKTELIEHFYYDLKKIVTKFSNMTCPLKCDLQKCTFCLTRETSLLILNQSLDNILVSPLYRMRIDRAFHNFGSYGYPENLSTYSNITSLQRDLTSFKTKVSSCQPSVISNDIFEKVKFAFDKIHSFGINGSSGISVERSESF